MSLHTPDLTKQPPRSPRVRLGGYVILPRCWTRAARPSPAKTANTITPARSTSSFLKFAGIDPKALKKELKKSDTEVLEWINDPCET